MIKLIEDSTKPDQQERKEEEEEETTSNTEQNTSRPTSSSAAESPTLKAQPSDAKEKTEIQKTNEANYATTIKYFPALSLGIEQVQFNSRNDKAFTVFIIIESITTSLNQFIKHDAGDNETEHKLIIREAITQELRDAGLLKVNGRFFSPKETHKLIALNRSYGAHIAKRRQ